MLAKSEICQKCANCCKEFQMIEYNRDWALRWLLLEHPKICIDEKEIDGRKLWIVTFKIKCKKLRYDTKEEKFYCEIHGGDRPQFCRDYPDNIPITEWEIHKEYCPISNNISTEIITFGNQNFKFYENGKITVKKKIKDPFGEILKVLNGQNG